MGEDRPNLVEIEDTVERGHRRPAWTGWLLAVVITLGMIAVIVITTRGTAPEVLVAASTTTTNTTVPVPVPPVTVAPTTLEPGEAPSPQQTLLGTLTWVEADYEGLKTPIGEVQYDPVANGYVIQTWDDQQLWRSEDGLVWSRDEEGWPFEEVNYVSIFGDYAWTDNTGLYRAVDGEWVEVSMDDILRPEIEGLVWATYPGLPQVSQDAELVPVEMVGRIPWEEIYGYTESDCNEPEPCRLSPWAGYSSYSHRMVIHHPVSGNTMATLDAITDGSDVVLVDVDSGEVVHRVTLPTTGDATNFIDSVRGDATLTFNGIIVTKDGNTIFTESPWKGRVTLAATEEGVFAFEDFEYPPGTLDDPPRIWVTQDGQSWEDLGTPSFLPERYQYAFVRALAGRLRARVVETYDFLQEGGSDWVSSNGVEWTEVDTELTADAWIQEVDAGYFATTWEYGPTFWVSNNAEKWEEVEFPAPVAGYVTEQYGASRDLVYHSSSSPGGRGKLFIGRFSG